jgi:4-amino-4-deoxy-L-arabinose transferase-like glycosyltransferase
MTDARGWPSSFRACGTLALVLGAVFLLCGLDRTGIWDPHELDRVELARRIAVQVFHADDLRVAGAPNGMPTLSDLGAGELGFTSMALGLRVFGLHDWAGRLPLALWALGGVLFLYLLLARLVQPRAGLYAAIALSTMPAYLVQARTMLGDAPTMVSWILAFGGLAGAIAERRSRAWAAAFALAGVAGCVTGLLSRGALVGVAAPALGVGLGWLALAGANRPPPEGAKQMEGASPLGPAPPWARTLGTVAGLSCLVLGGVAAWLGAESIVAHGWGHREVSRLAGVAVLAQPPVESTFDLTVRDLGHGLFPWSAFVPVAFGLCLAVPPEVEGEARGRETALRVVLFTGAAAAYAVYAFLAPYTGSLPFAAPAALAALAGIALFDLERGARPAAGPAAAATLLLGLVLLRDLRSMPLKSLSAYALPESQLPRGFEATGIRFVETAAATFLALVVLTAWMPRAPGALDAWLAGRWRRWREIGRELGSAWGGNLVFGFLLVEASLVGLGGMLVLGRRFGWSSVANVPQQFALVGLNAWWIVPLVVPLVVATIEIARGLLGRAHERLRLPAAAGIAAAAVAAGLALGFGQHPAVASRLSPKEAFQAYAELHEPGEPLGLLGLRARVAHYYAGGETVESLGGLRAALGWLGDGKGARRWLIFRSKDLGELNALYRERAGANLPVLDARSGQILLAASDLRGGRNDNPLEPFVLSGSPEIDHPVTATLSDELESLGWTVVDEAGATARWVEPGKRYTMRFYWRVLRTPDREWKAFLHIDGQKLRHNGDHDPLGGRYKMTLWRTDDVIVDELPLELDPNFTPAAYAVYYGFFIGSERMPVIAGKHHEDRVWGGELVVR